MRRLAVALAAVALCAGPAAASSQLGLAPYLEAQVSGLVTVVVEIDGRPARMLFDTGAGVTFVTPAFAAAIGCRPYGSSTGFRMRGDRAGMQKCGARRLRVGERTAELDIGVVDLSGLLPQDADPIDGILALDAFEDRLVTFDLSNRRLHLDRRPGEGWVEGVVRFQRALGGAALTPFVKVAAPTGDLWLLLDSGHVGDTPVYLSPGAIEQLGGADAGGPLTLAITGAGEQTVRAVKVDKLIYDGVLGEQFLRRFDIAVDFRSGRIWWRPHAGQGT